jgi:hypothetical protein
MLKEIRDVVVVIGIILSKIKIQLVKRLKGLGHFYFPT